MICDVSTVIKNDGAVFKVDGTVLENDAFNGTDFSMPEGVKVEGTLTCRSGVLELLAKAEGEIKSHCARCLKDLAVPFSFEFEEILAQEGAEISDKDSVILFEGTSVDLSEIVLNNVFLNVDGKYLCKDDCFGLCPKCGKDLNEGKCTCTDDEIDPRWEKLKNFK